MSLGSLLRIGVEVTLVGMILSAMRQNTGFIFAYEQYGMASYLRKFLKYGDYCYNAFTGYCTTSSYFRKQNPLDG
ncbi:hypothetical protein MOSE0_H00430 [Monosporozyma servazzii]